MKLILILTSIAIATLVHCENSDDDEETEIDPHKHPYGRPVNLMRGLKGEEFEVNEEEINNIFDHPEVADRKIVAISIIGAFRKGKSFLMDYALRFMYGNYKSIAFPNNTLENKQNWVGDHDEPLKGFSWRGGTVRDTEGVVIWSDVFLHEYVNDGSGEIEKIAIIIMDTQGLFDQTASPETNSRIFALGTLISSLQIFNLNDVIQENQLEYLQMATEFAKLAQKTTKKGVKRIAGKPFQTLLFLMRDWRNEQEYDFGSDGGAQYLAKVLNVDPKQPQALQDVRNFIADSFETRSCYLLPYPGTKVVNNKEFNGRFRDLDTPFQTHLKKLLHWMLEPEKLKKKKVLNMEVTGTEYLQYMKMYFEAYKSGEIPEVHTLHSITVNKQFEIIREASFNIYKNLLQKVEFKTIGENETQIWRDKKTIEDEMEQKYETAIKEARKTFAEKKKMGSKRDEQEHLNKLNEQMKNHFDEWKREELNTYTTLKTLEEEQEAKIKRLKKEEARKLEEQRKKSEAELALIKKQHEEQTKALNETLEAVRRTTSDQIQKIMNETKADLEQQKAQYEQQLKDEKERYERERIEKEQQLNGTLNTMMEQMRKQEEAAQKLRDEVANNKLEELKMQAEMKEKEFQQQLKIEAMREKAENDRREYEIKVRAEERKIREEKEARDREERKKEAERRAEQDKQFMQQLMLMKQESDMRNAEAQRRHDEMVAKMTAANQKRGK